MLSLAHYWTCNIRFTSKLTCHLDIFHISHIHKMIKGIILSTLTAALQTLSSSIIKVFPGTTEVLRYGPLKRTDSSESYASEFS